MYDVTAFSDEEIICYTTTKLLATLNFFEKYDERYFFKRFPSEL